jgi:hypothetical protein
VVDKVEAGPDESVEVEARLEEVGEFQTFGEWRKRVMEEEQKKENQKVKAKGR